MNTVPGLGPLTERYFLIVRYEPRRIFYWSEDGHLFSANENTATPYGSQPAAHDAILRHGIESAEVVSRVRRRCCATPQPQGFNCDGSGGAYDLEWCAACGALRFEEHTEGGRKFCEWIRPSTPDPGQWRAVLGALVGTLPKCDECNEPATRSPGRGRERRCDDHPEISRAPGEFFYCRDEYPRAGPLRAAIAMLKGERK